jgi:hypothetical protein
MKSTKTFNNISDKLKASIPKLKSGERVVFLMLNGTPNPEPDDKERSKSPILYPKIQIQTNFRAYDPYLKDEAGTEVGGYVDVGCVDVWVKDQPEKFRCFVPGSGEFAQFQGKFELTGGNIRDEELYEVLFLSNQREGNPNRDISIEPLFKILDAKADSNKLVTRFETLKKALDTVKDIKEEKARKIMAALNQPNYQDKEVLLAKIGEYASTNPDLFLKINDDPTIDIKYRIKEAFDKGVLNFDFPTSEVKMGNTLITKLSIGADESQVEAFYGFVNNSENGKAVMSNVDAQLAGKEKIEKPVS